MYLKTIHEVKKWMLYRPMIPGSRDILFSGAVTTSGDPENDVKLKPEVEHLTCFIGGMIGMAAKIFELDSDLEIAKKLTNGCVWAYSMTPSGIMPESSTVMPCESTEHCTWNETAYWNYLDPAADYRDEMLEEYIANKAAREAEVEAARVSALAKAEATSAEEAGKNIALDEDMIPGEISPPSNSTNTPLGSDALKKDTPASLQKRQTQSSPKEEVPLPITHDFRDDVPERKAKSGFAQPPSGELQDVSSPAETTPTPTDKKSKSTEDELRDISIGGHKAEVPLTGGSTAGEVLPDPQRPLSHKEWVEARIKQEALPPGFVTIRGRKYILRSVEFCTVRI
jgi:mannosyl-oligosaccharide alpha-1,2-mannosidase